MRLFRIERKKYLNSCLDGIGASKATGFRWNSLDTRLVYTAESRALAMLEVSVHLDLSTDLPNDRLFVEIEVPNDLKAQEVDIKDLPDGWDNRPPIRLTQQIGDAFVHQQKAAVLKVPSCIVPNEYNYLINPLHPDAQRIRVVHHQAFLFDPRLQRKKK